jgi:hypothetical protein
MDDLRLKVPNSKFQHDVPSLDSGRKLSKLVSARVTLVALSMFAQNSAFA